MDRLQKQKDANTDLKHKQIAGEVPTIKANMSDVQIPENEQHLFHVKVTKSVHNPAKKKYDDHTKVITLNQKDVTQMNTHKGQGWNEWDEHKFLHDPTKPMETEEERIEREKQEAAVKDLKAARADYKKIVDKAAGNTWDIATIKQKQQEFVDANVGGDPA